MDIEQNEADLSQWFSTYGLITAERILGKYQIKLGHEVLLAAIKNPGSFYNRLLQVPLKHVLNGIVIQQAYDYHVYVQKLFIDYLLSGNAGTGEESPGKSVRDSLEEERSAVLEAGEAFNKLQFVQDTLVANSQSAFIETTKAWSSSKEAALKTIAALLHGASLEVKVSSIASALDYAVSLSSPLKQDGANRIEFVASMSSMLQLNLSTELQEKIRVSLEGLFAIAIDFESALGKFYEDTKEINYQARLFRAQFYDAILRVIDLIKLLPEYKINPEQDQINREALEFDKSLGGE